MTLATFCPRCGTPRNGVAEFCVACGTSLSVPGPTPPPELAPATGPGAATGTAAALPYAAPGAPDPVMAPPVPVQSVVSGLQVQSAPRDRTSALQLLASVVGISIGVAALAIAATISLSGKEDGGPADDTTPPANSQTQVVDVLNIQAEVPATWSVVTRARDTIVVEDGASHALWLRSARLPGPITFDQIQQRYLDKARGQSPDAKVCAGPETAALPGGPTGGRYLVICSTYVPLGGGPAVRLADVLYVGLDDGAVTAFVMQLTAVPGAIEAFAAQVRALPPPVWKLYGG